MLGNDVAFTYSIFFTTGGALALGNGIKVRCILADAIEILEVARLYAFPNDVAGLLNNALLS